MKLLEMDPSLLEPLGQRGLLGRREEAQRDLPDGGARAEAGVLDETDSGLDIDALKVVADGVNALRGPDRAVIVVTHYQRLLNYIVPDFVHVLSEGRIVRSRRQGAGARARGEGLRLARGRHRRRVTTRPMPATASQDSLLTGFDEFAAARAAEPAWLRSARASAAATFRDEGLPTTRHEEWRFTPLAGITDVPGRPAPSSTPDARVVETFLFQEFDGPQLVFVDGRHAPELSRHSMLPAGVRIATVASLLDSDPGLLQQHLGTAIRLRQQGFTALNDAWFSDGVVVVTEANAVVEAPIHVLYFSTGAGTSYPRTLVVAGTNSQVSIVESFAGADAAYVTNAITEIVAADGAHVDHYKVNRESLQAFHVASTHLQLSRASVFATHNISLGGLLTRNDINATLDGEGIECTVNGLYLADGDRIVDTTRRSTMRSRTAAASRSTRACSTAAAAACSTARSSSARTRRKPTPSRPTRCCSSRTTRRSTPSRSWRSSPTTSSARTVRPWASSSAEALFYLRARGIGEDDARALLIHAFAESVVENIRIDGVRHALEQVLLARLPIRE